MERDKLITRKIDSKDARKRLVFITVNGQNLRDKILIKGIDIVDYSLGSVSEENVKIVLDNLLKVRSSLDEYLKEN